MRKAEISIGFIASISLAILGFTLVLLFVSQTTNGKQFYCNNIAHYINNIGISQEDFCLSYQKIEFAPGNERSANITDFPNENIMDLFRTNATLHPSFAFNMTKDSRIQSATMSITNGNPIGYITHFNGQDFKTIITFDFSGGIYTLYLNVSKNIKVTRSKLKVEGYNVPGKVDLVFVIDQSGSMYNEWADICGSINQLKDNLSRTGLGVDVTSTIYGLSDSGAKTTGACKNADIKDTDLVAAMGAMGTSFAPITYSLVPPDKFRYPAFDQKSEAWGAGVYWASKYHPWRNNTKKILFPVSDSDPTGGGPVLVKVNQNGKVLEYLEDPLFSGNEQAVISAADQAAQADRIYVFPIYGDDDPTETNLAKVEGYHVGSGSRTCDPNLDMQCGCDPIYSSPPYSNVCLPIIAWMRQLTHYPQSRFTGYRNPNELKKFMQYVLVSNYPHDVVITVNGKTIFSNPGPLDNTNSPQWADENAFAQALEDAGQNCNQPSCQVTVQVSSSSEGAVILSELEVMYQQYIKDAGVDLNGNSIFYDPQFGGSEQIDFTASAQSVIDTCQVPDCLFNFTLSSSEPAKLLLSNLSVKYSKVFLEEDLLQSVLECYDRASLQGFAKNIRCKEIPVPRDHIFYKEVNESSITQLLINKKWCNQFSNSDYGCGEQDHLRFAHSFAVPTNILVEYDAKTRQVVVS